MMFFVVSCAILSSVNGLTTSSEMVTSSTPVMSSSTTLGVTDCPDPSTVTTLLGSDAATTECADVTSDATPCAWTTLPGFGCDFDSTLSSGSCDYAVNEPVCAPCQDLIPSACTVAFAESRADNTINCDTLLLNNPALSDLVEAANPVEGISISADVTLKEVCPMTFNCFTETDCPPATDQDCSGYFECSVECEVADERTFIQVTPQIGNGKACPESADQNCLYANSDNPDPQFQTLSAFQQCQESVSVSFTFEDGCDSTCESGVQQAVKDTFAPKEVDVTIIQTGVNQRRLVQGDSIEAIVVPSATATGNAVISFAEIVTTAVTNQDTFQEALVTAYQTNTGSTTQFEVTASESPEPEPINEVSAVAALQASIIVVAAGILSLIVA